MNLKQKAAKLELAVANYKVFEQRAAEHEARIGILVKELDQQRNKYNDLETKFYKA